MAATLGVQRVLEPIVRAVAQLDDRVFVGVLIRSVVLAVLALVGLEAACAWGLRALVGDPGWLGWLAGAAGAVGAAFLGFWLFVPLAVLIAALFSDRVANAVDRRFYPELPVPRGAPLTVQAWDGMALALQVLGLQLLALLLAVIIPGIGLVAGYVVTGWAIGRGLFVAVAMRRMGRGEAIRVYGARRWPVLMLGGLLALAATIPVLNLLVPVLGVAALTHVLNGVVPGPARPGLFLPRGP